MNTDEEEEDEEAEPCEISSWQRASRGPHRHRVLSSSTRNKDRLGTLNRCHGPVSTGRPSLRDELRSLEKLRGGWVLIRLAIPGGLASGTIPIQDDAR